MAQQIGALEANLDLQSASFESGLKRVEKQIGKTNSVLERSFGQLANTIKGIGGLIAADKIIDGTKKYLELADANKKMSAQMKLATAAFGNQGRAEQDANRIAKETRSNLQSTYDLYGKFMPTTRQLGRTQEDNARAVETFSKAMKVSNADTQSQMSATLQMGQALSGTNVQWEELGAIMDASPRLTDLFTESLGVTRGELKKMAEDGKLTSKMLYDALTDKKMTAKIDAEFRELPVTFADTVTLVENSASQLVGAFDRGAGIGEALSSSLAEGSSTMDELLRNAESTGAEIKAIFAGLSDAFDPLNEHGLRIFESLAGEAYSLSNEIREALSELDFVVNIAFKVNNADAWFDNQYANGANWVMDKVGAPKDWRIGQRAYSQPSNLAGRYQDRHDASRRTSARKRLVENIRKNGPDKNFDGKGLNDKQLAEYGEHVARGVRAGAYIPPAPKPRVSKNADDKKKTGGKGKDPAKEAERAAEKQRRDLDSFNRDIEMLRSQELDSREGLVSSQAERFALERQQLEADRLRIAADIDRDGPKGSKRYSQAQVDELKALNDKTDANKREALRLKEAEFASAEELKLRNGSLENAMEVAGLQSSLARTAKQRRDAELALLDLNMKQQKIQLEAIIASKDATDADKKIAAARLALLPQIANLQGEQVRQSTMGPLESYLDTIPKTGAEINEALEGIEVAGLQSLQDGILDTIKGVGDLGDAFSNMADTVISELIRIAIQKAIIEPIAGALFGGSSGGGGLLGGIIKGAVGARANGGFTSPGNYLVGEHGPEFLTVGNPAEVIPAHKTKQLIRGGANGGLTVNYGNITSNDPEAIKAITYETWASIQPMVMTNSKNATISSLSRPTL